jgi:hypothetical protein
MRKTTQVKKRKKERKTIEEKWKRRNFPSLPILRLLRYGSKKRTPVKGSTGAASP